MENSKLEDFINDFTNINDTINLTDVDKKFLEYSKLFKERFGREPYIAEPSGTKEDTIRAIKICLEKGEDILDKLLYPNIEEDLDDKNQY